MWEFKALQLSLIKVGAASHVPRFHTPQSLEASAGGQRAPTADLARTAAGSDLLLDPWV